VLVENVPYAILRLDGPRGRVAAGYMVVSPYYAALRRIDSTPQPLPVDHAGRRLWNELKALAHGEKPRPLDCEDAKETFLLVEEFARHLSPVLLSVEPITLAAPTFAAERLERKFSEWVEAERAGAPLCPYECRECDDRLQRTGTFMVADPGADRKLRYSCADHESQEADYVPVSGRWLDRRP
jgi:hypothetical protein